MLCWLVSWSSVIGGGKCLWNLRFIWCHSQVFQSSASWWFQRSHIEGLKIAESTSPDERCLKGGYQDWGTQSKHLTHMHSPALRVFGSDENWQWFLCNDYFCVCDPQLLGSLLRKPLASTTDNTSQKIFLNHRVSTFLWLNQDTGDGVCCTKQTRLLPKRCICKLSAVKTLWAINDSS